MYRTAVTSTIQGLIRSNRQILHKGLLPCCATVRQNHNDQSKTPWKPQLYVFDKYGTLVNIHTVWTPWALTLSQRLEEVTGLSLEEKIYNCLDICRYTKRFKAGMIDGTSWQIKQALERLLHDEGMSWTKAQTAVQHSWDDCTISDPVTLKELEDVQVLFKEIKSSGAKIAICSSDLRSSTTESLTKANLIGYVDHVVGGEDVHLIRSDQKEPVTKICEDLGVAPDQTVVIGDTAGDMKMGRAGNVALTVGVLSGIGTRLDLAESADVIADDVYQAVRTVQQMHVEDVVEASRKREQSSNSQEEKASLVIFDKDGTLVCFHSMWTPWAEKFISRLESATGLSLSEVLLAEMGYSEKENKWRPGVFTQGTDQQTKEHLTEVLTQEGMERMHAEKAIADAWPKGFHENDTLRILDCPTSLFKILKSLGIKVAVCTSDSRPGTEQFLKDLGAEPYVDMLVCGDDPESVPKPAADNALLICQKLGVDPARAVMVGDTLADMGMAKAAKLGASVAVLSGVGDVEHLESDADHMVPSIAHVLDVVTSEEKRNHIKDLYHKESTVDSK